MRKNPDKKLGPNLAVNIGVGGLTGLISTLILLLIIAVLTSLGKIPESFMKEITVLSCGVGALLGSYSAAKRQKGMAMLAGIGSSATMFALTLMLSILWGKGAFTGQLTFAVFVSIIAAGALGAIFSAVPHKVKR